MMRIKEIAHELKNELEKKVFISTLVTKLIINTCEQKTSIS